jgi:general secretion pathway protein L
MKKVLNRLASLQAAASASTRLPGSMLELWLPTGWPEVAGPILWRRSGGAEVRRGRCADILECTELARGARVHVWTPTGETLLTQATLPTRSRQKIMQALPYALEDQLLDDPGDLHFAYVEDAGGRLAVAATARQRLENWNKVLTQAGIAPASMAPACLSVPWSVQAWALAIADHEAWLRTGAASGTACPRPGQDPPAILRLALAEARAAGTAPETLLVFGAPAELDANAWGTALGLTVHASPQAVGAWEYAALPNLNLLQGAFARHGPAGDALRPLRPALIMLALWLVGVLALGVYDWWTVRAEYNSYRNQMTDILLKSFPETKVVLDPAQQMSRGLEQLQKRGGGAADTDLVPLLARTAPMLRKQSQLRVAAVRYADRSLTLDLLAPSAQVFETLKQELRGAHIEAELLSTAERGKQVEGRMRIQPPRAAKAS